MPLTRRERVVGQYCSLMVEPSTLVKPIIHLQVPKKIASKAVDRNLIKRRLRSIVLPYRPRLTKVKIIIGVKQNLALVEFKKIKEDLINLLNKYVV